MWMTTQISSNDAPDIVMMHGSEYSDRGWYENLNEIMEEQERVAQIADEIKNGIK